MVCSSNHEKYEKANFINEIEDLCNIWCIKYKYAMPAAKVSVSDIQKTCLAEQKCINEFLIWLK